MEYYTITKKIVDIYILIDYQLLKAQLINLLRSDNFLTDLEASRISILFRLFSHFIDILIGH